jgi:hypothetical protein
MTSQDFCYPFPVDETDAALVMLRLHLRPNPRLRTQFRTLPFSITTRSPDYFHPQRMMLRIEHRALRDVAGVAATAREENGKGVREGEDSFGTHGRACYVPRTCGGRVLETRMTCRCAPGCPSVRHTN